MTTITLTKDTRISGQILARFHYDPDTIADIKTIVGRRWDPERRVWTIPADMAGQAIRVLRAAGHHVIADDIEANGQQRGPVTEDQALDALLKRIPADQHRRVLRSLAAASHPDLGGDPVMSRWANERLERVNS